MGSLVRRFRWWLWRVRQQIKLYLRLLPMLLDAMRGRIDELWIGDSHAPYMTAPDWPVPELRRVQPDRWVWHHSARLMWSIASRGFDRDVRIACRLLGLLGRSAPRTLILTAGEIDIRCHLAQRLERLRVDGLGFPQQYVERGVALGRTARVERVIFLLTPPPSDQYQDFPGFKITGTLEERIEAWRMERAELAAAVAATSGLPRALLLDATDDLVAPDGSFRDDMTVDGIHANDACRTVVRAHLDRLKGDVDQPLKQTA